MFYALSTGEGIYVALAANRADLLGNDSLVDALKQLGTQWLEVLILRHQYD